MEANAKTEMAFSMEIRSSAIGFCNVSRSIYYAIDQGRMLEVKSGDIRPINVTTLSGTSDIEVCSRGKMVVGITNDLLGSSVHIFDPSNDGFSPIRNFNGITPSRSQNDGDSLTGVLENDRGELFSFGFLPPFIRTDWRESQMIKIGLTPMVVPQLMLLGDE